MSHLKGKVGILAYDSQTGKPTFHPTKTKKANKIVQERTGGGIVLRTSRGNQVSYHRFTNYKAAVQARKELKKKDTEEDLRSKERLMNLERQNKKTRQLYRKITR